MQATSLQSNSEVLLSSHESRYLLRPPVAINAGGRDRTPGPINLAVGIPAWFGRVAVRNGANGKWRQVGVAQRHHRTLRRQSEAKAPSSTTTQMTARR